MDFDVTTDRASSDWLARIRSGRMTLEERGRFDLWLRDPANRSSFEAMSSTYERLDRWADDPAVLEARAAALQRARKPSRSYFLPAAAAVVAALMLGLLLFAMPSFGPGNAKSADEILQTGSNQRKFADLEDGSRVVLDGNTVIAVRFGKAKRQVFLRQGRAYFTVARDAKRPFVVHGDLGSVYAVGTAFSVDDRQNGGMKVLLTEGKVRVELTPVQALAARRTIEMVQGTELSVDRKGWAIRHHSTEPALAWTEGFLVFDDMPLADAVAEFNASSRRTIMLEPGLGRQRISGTFRSGMADDFARALASYGIARIDQADDRQIVLASPMAK